MTRALVLQHIYCEPPGIYEDVLAEHEIGIVRVEIDEGAALPDWRDDDIIVTMGGPMSVNDEAVHPWLAEEKVWIASAVGAGVPYFGACLGAQLLAASLGAPVRAGELPEVGVLPVTLTADGLADPVMSVLGQTFSTLQWHGDTFELPNGAVHLGRSSAYEHQAFRVGSAFAVQFHLEVTPSMFKEWANIPAYVAPLSAALGASGLDTLTRSFDAAHEDMGTSARRLFESWLSHSLAGRKVA